jgi:hypothetical protein
MFWVRINRCKSFSNKSLRGKDALEGAFAITGNSPAEKATKYSEESRLSSPFLETLGRLGITDRARRAPEGNSYIERFYRSLKEEEGLDGRVSERGGSTGQHRSPDRGVPSRPASSWSRKPDSV